VPLCTPLCAYRQKSTYEKQDCEAVSSYCKVTSGVSIRYEGLEQHEQDSEIIREKGQMLEST
jgi:hypothetical protein